MKSSYFPHIEESELSSETPYVKRICPPPAAHGNSSRAQNRSTDEPIIYPVHNHNDGLLHFPSSTRVLWDRTTLAPPIYLKPSEVLPNLILGGREVKKLLSLMDQSYELPSGSAGQTFNANAYVYHHSTLPKTHQALVQLLSRGIVQDRSDYYLSFERHTTHDLQLTIPIVRSANVQLNSIQSLQDNLWRSVSSSKEFSLKHYVRIRAQGSLNKSSDANGGRGGKFRFEAIVPDVALQVVPVYPLPILSTAMATTLLDTGSDAVRQSSVPTRRVDARLATFEATNMGYMTLNQTRKVVFLADSDSSLSSTPVIGVWVRIAASMNPQAASEYDWASLARHPYCWTAAMRFLFHERLAQRVYVAQDTFLMAMLVGESVYFCEVTASVGSTGEPVTYRGSNNADSNEENDLGPLSRTTTRSLDFVHLDFTASLNSENDIDMGRADDQMGGVVCRFKPVLGHASSANRLRLSPRPTPSQEEPSTPESSPKRFNLLSPMSTTVSPEKAVPPPSASFPPAATSQEAPPGTFSAMMTAKKQDALTAAQLAVPSKTGGASSLPVDYYHEAPSQEKLRQELATRNRPGHSLQVDEQLAYRFPADIVASQQQQIAALQDEVASLKAMIRLLTTNVAAAASGAVAATATANGTAATVTAAAATTTTTTATRAPATAPATTSAAPQHDVSLLFDSFQRQVMHVLRASHEGDPTHTTSDAPRPRPIPVLLGSEAGTLDTNVSSTWRTGDIAEDNDVVLTKPYGATTNNTDASFSSSSTRPTPQTTMNKTAGVASHAATAPHNNNDDRIDEDDIEEEDDDDLVLNSKDYDESEVAFFVRRNFRPSVPSSYVQANVEVSSVDRSQQVSGGHKSIPTTTTEASLTPSTTGPSAASLPKKKKKSMQRDTTSATTSANKATSANNKTTASAAPATTTAASSATMMASFVDDYDTNEYDVVDEYLDEDVLQQHRDDEDFADEVYLPPSSILHRSSSFKTTVGSTPVRGGGKGAQPSSMPSAARPSPGSAAKSSTAAWLDEAERSLLRESESILAIESKYR